MGFEFFGYLFLKGVKSGSECNKTLAPKSVGSDALSPRKKERLKKNKSIEDFMKHQVPWIL